METTKEVALTPAEVFVQKSKSSAQLKFETTVREAQEISLQCRCIKIMDTTELAMAEQALSKANKALKLSEERRKEIGKPYSEIVSFINSYVKENITSDLEEAISFGKEQLRKWNEAEKKKKEEAESLNKKHFDNLAKVKDLLNKKVQESNTVDACEKSIKSIKEKFPATSVFGIYAQESIQLKDSFIALLNARKATIAAAISNNTDAVDVVTQELKKQDDAISKQEDITAIATDKSEVLMSNNVANVGNVRKVAKFEVVNEDDLSREFMSVDPAKVRAYMATIKEKITSKGIVIGGIRFFIDEVPIIK